MTLFEAAAEIGGQFNLARRIPGKEEFAESLRYFRTRVERPGAKVVSNLNRRVGAEDLGASVRRGDSRHRYQSHAYRRHSWHRSFQGRKLCRHRGRMQGSRPSGWRSSSAGGIGFRRSLSCLPKIILPTVTRATGAADDPAIAAFAPNGASTPSFPPRRVKPAHENPPPRKVWLLQRKTEKVGAGLAKTTGWIRRTLLKRRGVRHAGRRRVRPYRRRGFATSGSTTCRSCSRSIRYRICAGQEPRREPGWWSLEAAGIKSASPIGGADVALEPRRGSERSIRGGRVLRQKAGRCGRLWCSRSAPRRKVTGTTNRRRRDRDPSSCASTSFSSSTNAKR